VKTLIAALMVVGSYGTAFAADLSPRRASLPVQAMGVSWAGPYVGVHAGYGWGKVGAFTTATGAAPISSNLNGMQGGAYAGYNFLISQFLLGVEADFTISGVDGNPNYSAYASPDGYNYRQKYAGSLRLRAGLPINNLLIYATGGVAIGSFSSSYYSPPTPLRNEKQDATHSGFVAGLGAEYAISRSVSVRLEYLYTKYSAKSYGFNNAAVLPANSPVTFEPKTHAVRAGVAWRF
jgi:outer membrane immunogenic protein